MIFLPNFFDRYTAALRNTVHTSAIKKGKKQKHFNNMRKIYLAEACWGFDEGIPLDLGEYVSRLLTSLYIMRLEKEDYFEFRVNIKGRYIVEVKKITAFLLTACKKCEKVEFFEYNGKPTLKIKGYLTEKSKKILKRLNKMTFFEIKSEIVVAVFQFDATEKNQIETYFGNFDINNPFSAVNIFCNTDF